MTDFQCPVCREALLLKDRTYCCVNRHTFDVSRQGYVNLTRSNKKGHGDEREMVKARTRFLNTGAYAPLKAELTRLIAAFQPKVMLDSGCGEGYYTELSEQLQAETFGVDLSKDALKNASRLCPHARFAAASVFELPLADQSVDLIWSCFAPLAPMENARVLKQDGILIVIGPAEKHLMSLKQVLYDRPYPNPAETEALPCFKLTDQKTLSVPFTLTSQTQIQDLFTMTPYYYKTSLKDKEKLRLLDSLDTEAQFLIRIYRRDKDC